MAARGGGGGGGGWRWVFRVGLRRRLWIGARRRGRVAGRRARRQSPCRRTRNRRPRTERSPAARWPSRPWTAKFWTWRTLDDHRPFDRPEARVAPRRAPSKLKRSFQARDRRKDRFKERALAVRSGTLLVWLTCPLLSPWRAMAQIVDARDSARNAAERHAWREAYDAYTGPTRTDLTPDDLERFADAAWWTGRLDEAIELRERSYAGFAAAGDTLSAARLALTLSWDHLAEARSPSRRAGSRTPSACSKDSPNRRSTASSLSRAESTAVRRGESFRGAHELRRAYELGGRFGDRDTQVLALVGKGRALVKSGDVEQGLALLDEASDVGGLRRAPAVLDRARLLHHDQLVPGPRRLPARGRVDRGGEPLVRPGSTSPASPAPAASTAPRSCACAATGPRPRSRRSRPVRSSTTSTARSPPAATTRSARSAAGAATSRPPRRRTARRTSSDGRRSPASRSSGSPRARSTARSPASRARLDGGRGAASAAPAPPGAGRDRGRGRPT